MQWLHKTEGAEQSRAETQQSANWVRECTFFCLIVSLPFSTHAKHRHRVQLLPDETWLVIIYQNDCKLQKKRKNKKKGAHGWICPTADTMRSFFVVVGFFYNASDGRLFWQMKALNIWVLRDMWHVLTTKFHHVTLNERRFVFYYCCFPK